MYVSVSLGFIKSNLLRQRIPTYLAYLLGTYACPSLGSKKTSKLPLSEAGALERLAIGTLAAKGQDAVHAEATADDG